MIGKESEKKETESSVLYWFSGKYPCWVTEVIIFMKVHQVKSDLKKLKFYFGPFKGIFHIPLMHSFFQRCQLTDELQNFKKYPTY